MPYDRLYHLAREDQVERFDDFLPPRDDQALEPGQQARMVTRFSAEMAPVHGLRAVEGGTLQ